MKRKRIERIMRAHRITGRHHLRAVLHHRAGACRLTVPGPDQPGLHRGEGGGSDSGTAGLGYSGRGSAMEAWPI